jgi:uncharacterized membrane protein YbhN (UPF0104 family)
MQTMIPLLRYLPILAIIAAVFVFLSFEPDLILSLHIQWAYLALAALLLYCVFWLRATTWWRFLRSLGVDRAASRREGNRAEQIRFYLVNSLLYLLFTKPRGSRLVGIENPDGHPGGFAVYSEREGNQ